MSSRPAAVLRAAAFVAALLACLTGAQANAPVKPWSGKATPALSLDALDGRHHDLSELRGRVVIVNFWATWCEPCLAEMPSLERLREKQKGRPFEVLAVNFGESRERASAYVAKLQLSLPVLLDRDKVAANAWKVGGLPMTFVVDARGRVRYSSFGERDWSDPGSMKLLEPLLKEAGRAR